MKTFELSKEIIQEISQLISNKKNKEIKKKVKEIHYADLAEIINELNFQESIYLIKLIDSDKTSDVLTELDEDVREKILERLSEKEIAGEIKELDSDDAADILSELSDEKQEKVIRVNNNVIQAKIYITGLFCPASFYRYHLIYYLNKS